MIPERINIKSLNIKETVYSLCPLLRLKSEEKCKPKESAMIGFPNTTKHDTFLQEQAPLLRDHIVMRGGTQRLGNSCEISG